MCHLRDRTEYNIIRVHTTHLLRSGPSRTILCSIRGTTPIRTYASQCQIKWTGNEHPAIRTLSPTRERARAPFNNLTSRWWSFFHHVKIKIMRFRKKKILLLFHSIYTYGCAYVYNIIYYIIRVYIRSYCEIMQNSIRTREIPKTNIL